MTALEQGRNAMEISMTDTHDDIDTPATPDRDAATTLTYEGADIWHRGKMLNLTDMWRAAGGPAARRPADWLRLEDTERFRSYQRWRWADIPNSQPEFKVVHDHLKSFEPDGLVIRTKGRTGETWAHWQLALAYARYLSPAFHTWCNAVVRSAMERHGGPPRRSALVRYVEGQFEQLHRKLDRIDRHAADQMFLLVSTQELVLDRRRPFSDRSRVLMCELISAEPYEGHCPCCHAAQVLGAGKQAVEGAEYDHFFHRGLNRPEHGWLICRACHLELTHGGYLARFGRMAEFRRFQTLILDARRQEARSQAERPALTFRTVRRP